MHDVIITIHVHSLIYCNNNDLFTAERLAMMSSLFDVLQQSFEGTLNTVKINSRIIIVQ